LDKPDWLANRYEDEEDLAEHQPMLILWECLALGAASL
jgi:hypothetical protein